MTPEESLDRMEAAADQFYMLATAPIATHTLNSQACCGNTAKFVVKI